MIKIKQEFSSIAPLAVETVVTTITVPDGHKYNFVEFNPLVPTGTVVYVYVEDERMLQCKGLVNAVDARRHVLNWELGPGVTVKITASNTTGGALNCGGGLTYDDVSS